MGGSTAYTLDCKNFCGYRYLAQPVSLPNLIPYLYSPPYIKNHRENNRGKYPPYMSIGF